MASSKPNSESNKNHAKGGDKKQQIGSPTSFQSPVFCQSEAMSSEHNKQITKNIGKEEQDDGQVLKTCETLGKSTSHHIHEALEPQK